jgi:hypothetical protein
VAAVELRRVILIPDLHRSLVASDREGDNVLTRLTKHDADEAKDFWTRTVVVTSKDENLTKAHVRYLESRLVQIIAQANRAVLANGTAPPAPPLPEPDVADMEFFLAQVQHLATRPDRLPRRGLAAATRHLRAGTEARDGRSSPIVPSFAAIVLPQVGDQQAPSRRHSAVRVRIDGTEMRVEKGGGEGTRLPRVWLRARAKPATASTCARISAPTVW